MEHSFDINLASEIGLEESIMMKHLIFWIKKNKANNKHFHKGRFWTYNSVSAFDELFPYFTKSQIRRILKSLTDKNFILQDNFNSAKYDRTKWFAIVDSQRFVDSDKWNCENTQMVLSKNTNAIVQNDKPIPYTTNTDTINTDTKTIYKMSIDIYHKFCLSNFDAPAKIDAVQGKAMKTILSYLKALCKQKGDDSQENILNALKYIFKNWKNLEPFLQKQVKLSQINSNLVNIIQQLKENKPSNNIADDILAKYRQ